MDNDNRNETLQKLGKIGTYVLTVLGFIGAFIAGFMFLGAAGLFTWVAGLDFIPFVIDDILAGIGGIFSFIGAVIIAIPSGILLIAGRILRDRLIDKFYSYTEDYEDRYYRDYGRSDGFYSGGYQYDDSYEHYSEQRSAGSSAGRSSSDTSSGGNNENAFSDPVAKMREMYKHCKNRTQLDLTHKNLRKIFHPDNGGSQEDFLAVDQVYEEMLSRFPD